MENANIEQLSRDILANSIPEIINPDLNDIIMNKIMQQKKQRSVVNYILLCSLVIIVVSAVIILLVQPGHTAGPVLPAGFDRFGNTIIINITNTGNWVMDNLYFLLPVLILLLIKKLIDTRLKHV